MNLFTSTTAIVNEPDLRYVAENHEVESTATEINIEYALGVLEDDLSAMGDLTKDEAKFKSILEEAASQGADTILFE